MTVSVTIAFICLLLLKNMSDYPIALFLCQEFSNYGRYNLSRIKKVINALFPKYSTILIMLQFDSAIIFPKERLFMTGKNHGSFPNMFQKKIRNFDI